MKDTCTLGMFGIKSEGDYYRGDLVGKEPYNGKGLLQMGAQDALGFHEEEISNNYKGGKYTKLPLSMRINIIVSKAYDAVYKTT